MQTYFYLLILISITITALPAGILLWHRQKKDNNWENRHPKISLSISVFLCFCAALIIYGSFIEPKFLIVKQQTIKIANLSQPIKIAFVADLQVGPYKKTNYVEKMVDKILALKPDLVFIGGDQINNSGAGEDEIIYLDSLKNLAQKIPTYAIHGNHEYGVSEGKSFLDSSYRLPDLHGETKTTLEKFEIHFLVNELQKITANSSSFYLFGGDEYWAGKLNLAALRNRKEKIPTLALIHNPAAAFDVAGYNVDLMLSGHTHGGQIRLPFLGTIIKIDPFIPRAWYKGLNSYRDMQLFVTSGVGETGMRARFWNPPEIVLINLVPKK